MLPRGSAWRATSARRSQALDRAVKDRAVSRCDDEAWCRSDGKRLRLKVCQASLSTKAERDLLVAPRLQRAEAVGRWATMRSRSSGGRSARDVGDMIYEKSSKFALACRSQKAFTHIEAMTQYRVLRLLTSATLSLLSLRGPDLPIWQADPTQSCTLRRPRPARPVHLALSRASQYVYSKVGFFAATHPVENAKMALPLIPLLSLILLSVLVVYRYLIYPAFLSPLSKVPNAHWSAPFSRLWILSYRRRELETPLVHSLHQRLGPLIRLAPDQISVNSVDGGIRTIYAGGYEKGDWYSNVFSNYGVMPMFAMPSHAPHSKRKRMVSNIYAKSTLQSSEPLAEITKTLVHDRLIARLRAVARSDEPTKDFYWIFTAVTMDIVSAYVFGLSQGTDYMREATMGEKFFADYKKRQRYQFWPQEAPGLVNFLKLVGLRWVLVPTWVDQANADIEAMILDMCDKAEKVVQAFENGGGKCKPQGWPTVYVQLRTALLKEAAAKSDIESASKSELTPSMRLTIASEMLDHTLAGFDTSSIVLTFYAYEMSLSSNIEWQRKLRQELAECADTNDAKTVDNLPVLHATLMETLRLHAAIPGNQPRITPAKAVLGVREHAVTDLPAGTRVQSQAWSLHRNPTVFPDPECWNPARWLRQGYASDESFESAQREMNKWFWAFGSGGRMCVGSNLAMYDMKAIIAAIWGPEGGFQTEVVEARGMVHRGGYVAEPVGWEGKTCVLSVREAKA